MGPIVVEATVRLGYAIFAVAALTFLGFGVQPPSPDWALQITDNYTLAQRGHVLVDGALPRARDRQPDRRRQPDRGRRAAGGRPVSTAEAITEHATLALELDELEVVYRVRGIDRQVLRGVSLSVERGEAYGLVGESGCGKSTAALAIVRYLPRNGRVRSGGASHRRPGRALAVRGANCGSCARSPSRWSTRTPAPP